MAGSTVVVSVLADSKQLKKEFDGIGNQTSGLSKALKGVAVVGAAAFTGAVVGIKKTVDMASDLQQSIGGVESVFKEFSGQTKKFSADAANNVGLAQNSYNELATIIGTTLKNSGTPMDQLAGKTNDLITVSADLAATFGGPVTQASNAMASALRGEFEPLRQYGVSLNQADINTKALAMSGKSSVDQLTKQEKALATQTLILEQSTDAAGAFARESDTLAGKQERLRANVENVATKIGTAFLPMVTLAVGVVGDLVSKVAESAALENFMSTVAEWGDSMSDAYANAQAGGDGFLSTLFELVGALSPVSLLIQAIVPILPDIVQGFKEFGQAVVDSGLKDQLLELGGAIGEALADAMVDLVPVLLELVAAFTELLPQIVPLIPAVIELLPPIVALIGPLTEFLAALLGPSGQEGNAEDSVNALKVALEVIGGVLTYVSGLWSGMLGILTLFMKFISGEFTFDEALAEFVNMEGWVGDLGKAALRLGQDIRNTVGDVVGKVREMASNIGTKIGEIIAFFVGLPGRILGAVGSFGSLLYESGKNIVQGLINGVGSLAQKAINSVLNIGKDMVNGVKGFLGIKSPSRVFQAIGEFTVEGLAVGLKKLGSVKTAMKSLSASVTAGYTPTLENRLVDGPAAAGAGSLASRVYQITVQAVAPAAEVGRAIVESIEEYERLNGKTA